MKGKFRDVSPWFRASSVSIITVTPTRSVNLQPSFGCTAMRYKPLPTPAAFPYQWFVNAILAAPSPCVNIAVPAL